MLIKVAGFDPSLRHWGIACGLYDTETKAPEITHLETVEPIVSKDKSLRASSKDTDSAAQLAERALIVGREAQAVFAEIPSGSQSARGALGNGVCFGVLGVLQSEGIPIYFHSARELKKFATGRVSASKAEMIEWAMKEHPDAPWPTYKKNNEVLISATKAEHMADAIAAIHTGVSSPRFQQLLRLIKA